MRGTRLTMALVLVAARPARSTPPHVLFLLADDFGWANLGVHMRAATGGADPLVHGVHTPTLDALIGEGILLERHYAYKICSPSRSSLQTGRLAMHVNSKNTGVAARNAADPVSGYAGIPLNMTGLGHKMRAGGYATHMVGKWDAGMATPAHTPEGRGYDSFFGFFQHASDYWSYSTGLLATGEVDNCLNGGPRPFRDLFRTNRTHRGAVSDAELAELTGGLYDAATGACAPDPEAGACYKEELFKQESLRILRGHDPLGERPLFLLHAFGALHTPLQVPAAQLAELDALVARAGGTFETRNQRLYAAMGMHMDGVVRDLVSEMKRLGMWRDTLLVFSSDNGGPIYQPGGANNYPLRGGKYSDFEGGVRTNAFVAGGWLPERVRGTAHAGLVSIADWYATLPALAGVPARDTAAERANAWLRARGLPELPAVDGVDQLDALLRGKEGRPRGLVLSTSAALGRVDGSLFKLVTGVQPYARHSSATSPNCSAYCAPSPDFLEDGPDFVDLKCVDHPLPSRADPAEAARARWEEDCAEQGCLYDLDADPTEHRDLLRARGGAGRAAERAHARLLRELRAARATAFEPERGALSYAACAAAVANGGVYGPFASVPEFGMNVSAWYTQPRRPEPSAAQARRFGLVLAAARAIERDGARVLTAVLRRLVPLLLQLCAKASPLSRLDECLARPDCNDGICIGPAQLAARLEASRPGAGLSAIGDDSAGHTPAGALGDCSLTLLRSLVGEAMAEHHAAAAAASAGGGGHAGLAPRRDSSAVSPQAGGEAWWAERDDDAAAAYLAATLLQDDTSE